MRAASAILSRAAVRGGGRLPVPNFLHIRNLSSSPHTVLGLTAGATKGEVKRSFYELAKKVHPDVGGGDAADSSSNAFTFVEVLAAYETLMAEIDAAAAQSRAATTAPNKAQRGSGGGAAQRRAPRRPPQARSAWRVGEILCEQLLDPELTAATLDAVWEDIKTTVDHPVSEFMLDALISACVRTGGGLDAAVALVQDGKSSGLLSSSAQQTSAVCAIMKWHGSDERMTFEWAVTLVDEWSRTPEDFERMQSAYYVHFGEDPLCVGFWKS